MLVQSIKRRVRAAVVALPIPDAVVLVWRYVVRHRRLPNLLRPTRFTEKILHRIMFDRRQLLCIMADKFGVRDYVGERIGDKVLPELLHVTTDPSSIPFDRLPARFVVKPTHGANWVRVVTDKTMLDQDELIRTCNGWLSQNYYEVTREWGYKRITPRIIVEELIDDGNGVTPNDYKLFVFNGRTQFILVIMGRFEERGHAVMTPSWERVDVVWPYTGKPRQAAPPKHLREMIEAAERLARDIDFVRVDFYDTDEKLFFGELTATPGCSLERWEPLSFDKTLGAYWKMSDRN